MTATISMKIENAKALAAKALAESNRDTAFGLLARAADDLLVVQSVEGNTPEIVAAFVEVRDAFHARFRAELERPDQPSQTALIMRDLLARKQ